MLWMICIILLIVLVLPQTVGADDLTLTSITPSTSENLAHVPVTVYGTGFSNLIGTDPYVTLEGYGLSSSVVIVSNTEMTAVWDLSSFPAGIYTAKVGGDSYPTSATLPNSFTITIPTPTESTPAQIAPYGGVLQNYTNTSGDVEIQTRVNIPLTVEDVAYPDWLFAILAIAGLVFCIIGIYFVAKCNCIPSAPILFCGIFAFGLFTICALMAPLVAHVQTSTDIVVNCTGEKTVMVEQTVTYLFSAWVGYACWGGALAGIVLAVAGALSWLGWLNRTGIGEAQKGQYLETDGEESKEEYFRMGKSKK